MNVQEKVYQAIASDKEPRDDSKIHVSDLVYDCQRKAAYSKLSPSQYFNFKTAMTFWIGRAIHKTPIFSEAEKDVKWNGVVGSVDEYDPATGTIIEKKTCREIPTQPYNHHKKQVEFYAYMLSKMGNKVDKAYILYIDVSKPAIKLYEVFLRSMAKIGEEFDKKVAVLEKFLENKELPKRNTGWICNYCEFANVCLGGSK